MNDPITTHRPRPATSGLLLKAAVVVPDVIISSLLWLVIIAALPPVGGFALTVAGMVIGALLAAGLGEDTAVLLLYGARRATPAEAPRLAVAWRIATHQLDADGVRLRIVTHGPPIATAGRRHLLFSREVVDAYCANEITAHAVAALITEGIGRLRHGRTRFDLLWTFWTIPWDFIRGIANAIGRRLAWIPLVQFAWRTLAVVGTIAVVLEAQAGRWPSPIIVGAFIALSYLMPRWRHAWHRHLCAPADRLDHLTCTACPPADGPRALFARGRRALTTLARRPATVTSARRPSDGEGGPREPDQRPPCVGYEDAPKAAASRSRWPRARSSAVTDADAALPRDLMKLEELVATLRVFGFAPRWLSASSRKEALTPR